MGHGYETRRKNQAGTNEKMAATAFSLATVVPHRSKRELSRAIDRKIKEISDTNYRMHLNGEEIVPTRNQKKIVDFIDQKDIVLINGPLGTGKTFWTCFAALKGIASGKYTSIALTAPAVEADEHIGFLKGSMEDKMAVHVNQILESFDDLVGKELRSEMQAADLIEIAPHAFNRGRTYKETLYILDECQNASGRQLLTSLGRLGFKSTFVYMGDDRQNDRTNTTSAFVPFIERFSNEAYADEIGHVTLTSEDVRRHPLLKKMMELGDFEPLPAEKKDRPNVTAINRAATPL